MEHHFIIIITLLIALQIFRTTILEKKYGRNKAYFITSLLYLPSVPYIFYAVGSNHRVYIWGILGIILAHILYSLYLLKFKSNNK